MTTTPLIRREEAGTPRLVGTLTVTALLSGVAIAGIYELTLPTIEANRARELRASVFEVVPGAAAMENRRFANGAWIDPGATGDAADAGDIPAGDEVEVVYAATDASGRVLGYAIEGEGPGYQDAIELIFGYDPATKRVTGMRVLESRETPGLGDKIYRDPAFVAQFDALAADGELVVTKGGASAPNEIDAITGATISSRAVLGIIQRALDTWRPRLESAPPTGTRAAPDGGGTP